MDSKEVESKSIPNSLEPNQTTARTGDDELIAQIAALITPTTDVVADWHFTDAKMFVEWYRPLMRVLRFFVEDGLPTHKPKPKRVIDFRNELPATVAA